MDSKELMKVFANNVNLHSCNFYLKSYHNHHKFMSLVENIEAFEINQSYVLLTVLTKNTMDEYNYNTLIHIFEEDFPIYCKSILNKLIRNGYDEFIKIKNCKCHLKNTDFSKTRFYFLIGFYD